MKDGQGWHSRLPFAFQTGDPAAKIHASTTGSGALQQEG